MSATEKDVPTVDTQAPSIDRYRRIVQFITRNYGTVIPKTVEKLQRELVESAYHPTPQLKTWINVIENLLEEQGRLNMTRKKALMIESIIGHA